MVGVVLATLPLTGVRIAMVGGATAVKVVGIAVVPPGPEAVTVSVFGPTGTVTGHEKEPDKPAVVVQSVTGPGPVITIVLPGVAVPEMVGVVLVETFIGPVTVRLGSPMMVKELAVVAVPPIVLAVAVTVFGPDGNVNPVTE